MSRPGVHLVGVSLHGLSAGLPLVSRRPWSAGSWVFDNRFPGRKRCRSGFFIAVWAPPLNVRRGGLGGWHRPLRNGVCCSRRPRAHRRCFDHARRRRERTMAKARDPYQVEPAGRSVFCRPPIAAFVGARLPLRHSSSVQPLKSRQGSTRRPESAGLQFAQLGAARTREADYYRQNQRSVIEEFLCKSLSWQPWVK